MLIVKLNKKEIFMTKKKKQLLAAEAAEKEKQFKELEAEKEKERLELEKEKQRLAEEATERARVEAASKEVQSKQAQSDAAFKKILSYIKTSSRINIVDSLDDLTIVLREIFPDTKNGRDIISASNLLSERTKSWLQFIELSNILYSLTRETSIIPGVIESHVAEAVELSAKEEHITRQVQALRRVILSSKAEEEKKLDAPASTSESLEAEV
jgi:hypothetical protein